MKKEKENESQLLHYLYESELAGGNPNSFSLYNNVFKPGK